ERKLSVPPSGLLCRSPAEGRQAHRPACGTADQARIRDQPQVREGARSYGAVDHANDGRRGDRIMKRREFITLLGGAAARPLVAHVQQLDQPKRIGMLMNLDADDAESHARLEAFLQELHQFGWIEGRNVRIHARWGAGDVDNFRRYAKELVALAPDV